MIDYLISNADDGPWITDPVIKIISVIYRSEMTLEKLHVRIQIYEIYPHFEISTFDLEIELSKIVRSVR